jgi:hypothetical protein
MSCSGAIKSSFYIPLRPFVKSWSGKTGQHKGLSCSIIPQRRSKIWAKDAFPASASIEDWLPEGHLARFVVEIVFTTQPSFLKRLLCRSQLATIQPGDADSGYFSKTKVGACERQGFTPYIAVDREDDNEPLWSRFQEPPLLPDNDDAGT